MSFRNLAAAAIASTALVAANVGPFAASAYAEPWHNGPRYSYQHFNQGKYKGGSRYAYNRHHKRHKSDNIGKGIAIGLGILLLGSILANADHHNDRYYDRY